MNDSTVSRSQALRRLYNIVRLRDAVRLPSHESIGHLAACDLQAAHDVPDQAYSLRDGFAIHSKEIATASQSTPAQLNITQRICADSRETYPLNPGNTARILTGGPLPPGADCVLPEENVTRNSTTIVVHSPAPKGQFIRDVGQEIGCGEIIVRAGARITPQAAGILTRSYCAEAYVSPPVKAHVFAIGSELSDPTTLKTSTGRFPADNLVLTSGLLEQCGIQITAKHVLPDTPKALKQRLQPSLLPDIIITTGGTGRSERDFTRSCVCDSGFTLIASGIDMRPGKNMFIAHKGNSVLFALPGPPAAVFVCLHAVVLPFIRFLRGMAVCCERKARLTSPISARSGGERIVLCQLDHHGSEIRATPLTNKDVSPLLALARANGVLPIQGGTSFESGDVVAIEAIHF